MPADTERSSHCHPYVIPEFAKRHDCVGAVTGQVQSDAPLTYARGSPQVEEGQEMVMATSGAASRRGFNLVTLTYLQSGTQRQSYALEHNCAVSIDPPLTRSGLAVRLRVGESLSDRDLYEVVLGAIRRHSIWAAGGLPYLLNKS